VLAARHPGLELAQQLKRDADGRVGRFAAAGEDAHEGAAALIHDPHRRAALALQGVGGHVHDAPAVGQVHALDAAGRAPHGDAALVAGIARSPHLCAFQQARGDPLQQGPAATLAAAPVAERTAPQRGECLVAHGLAQGDQPVVPAPGVARPRVVTRMGDPGRRGVGAEGLAAAVTARRNRNPGGAIVDPLAALVLLAVVEHMRRGQHMARGDEHARARRPVVDDATVGVALLRRDLAYPAEGDHGGVAHLGAVVVAEDAHFQLKEGRLQVWSLEAGRERVVRLAGFLLRRRCLTRGLAAEEGAFLRIPGRGRARARRGDG